ncbi:MAG: GTPase Era [Calditrichia bacterium]|nr:GTPase Era [Calditrichia bacterium]
MTSVIDKYKNFKCGYVTIIGKPNVGKSTLMNRILGEKLSIVTSKAQTTRKNVLGILNNPGKQIIFQDTPGMINPSYKLQEIMMEYVGKAVNDADIIIYIAEVSHGNVPKMSTKTFEKKKKPVILLLNKIDLIKKNELLPIIEAYQKIYPWDNIIPLSALEDDGVDSVLNVLESLLPVHPPYYPEDYLTDQPEKFFVAEMIREKIFEQLSEKIPYSTHVEIDQFKEREKGKFFIQATIFVERRSQKKIVIGKSGSMIKSIGQSARVDIEKFVDQEIYLELFVKIFENWRKKEGKLKTLGFRRK